MKNLLKADFYKILKSKSLYICSGIAAALAVMGVVVLHMAQNLIMSSGVEVNIYDTSGLTFVSGAGQAFEANSLLFVGIIVAVFIGSEFTNGTIKNTATKAYSRTQIFLSKWVTSVVFSNILMALYAITFSVLAIVLWGFGTAGPGFGAELFKMIVLQAVVNTAYTSIFVLLTFLTRQSGGAVAANLCFMMFISTVVTLVEFLVNYLTNNTTIDIAKYMLTNIITELGQMNLSGELVIRTLVMSGIVLIITMVFGVMNFRRRDIK